MTKIVNRIAMCAMIALGAAGCAEDAEPVDRTENGSIADGDSVHDGRTCDAFDLTVGEGWTVDIRMTSEYDNIVFLSQNGEQIAMNDDGDQGLNAHLEHTTTAAGQTTIHACAYSDGRGDYTLAIRANPAQ